MLHSSIELSPVSGAAAADGRIARCDGGGFISLFRYSINSVAYCRIARRSSLLRNVSIQ